MSRRSLFAHTLLGADLKVQRRLYRRYGVSGLRYVTAAWCLAVGGAAAPIKASEARRWPRSLAGCDEQLGSDPLFVIGHWRSGTTHLHNLLACDPAFGWPTLLQCLTPGTFLSGNRLWRPLVSAMLPERRPMDNMGLAPDVPEEEELALSKVTPLSFINCFHFPQHARDIFIEQVLMDNAAADDVRQWRQALHWFLCKVSAASDNRPLVLKNPANTARVRQLLELYPDAKFLNIVRNPFDVFRSTVHLWKRMTSMLALQDYDSGRLAGDVLWSYKQLMRRYLADRKRIPPAQLLEIRFEDLEADPIDTLEHVYDRLDLGDFDRARPGVQQHLDAIGDYRKNTFERDAASDREVRRHWAFAFEAWGY